MVERDTQEQPSAAPAPTPPWAPATASSSVADSDIEPGSEADPLLGLTIGNFRIVRLLGRGGMGAVYLGEHVSIGSRVAMKFLHPHLAHEQAIVDRFYAEARAANLAGHEHIVSVLDLNLLPPDRYYLVMEYLEGRPLSAIVGQGPLAPEVAVPILVQTCEGLQAAHAAGVVHRDLKFENIFLSRRGGRDDFVKILDFGIAKLLDPALPGLTSAGLLVGTPEYMAPEQWMPGGVDGRADIYTLGIIAYGMLTSRMPFYEKDPASYFTAHREKQPDPLRRWVPGLPEALEAAVLRALVKDPARRYPDANGFAEALRASLVRRPKPAPPLPSRSAPAPKGRVEPGRTTGGADRKRPAAPAVIIPEPPPALVGAPAAAPAPADAAARGRPMARVTGEGIVEQGAPVAELTRGGMLLVTAKTPPPLRARVKVQVADASGGFECAAEIVRHVSVEQARLWNLEPGFGVQFLEVSAAVRAAIDRIRTAAARPAAAPAAAATAGAATMTAPAAPDAAARSAPARDVEADEALRFWRERAGADPYSILRVDPDADCAWIRLRGHAARGELEALKDRGLGADQAAEVGQALEWIASALRVLGVPGSRAEHDAERGNFRGVARCLAAGLTRGEAEAMRREFLAARPDRDQKAAERAAAARLFEAGGELGEALREYQLALEQDPLALELHGRFWSLKRRLARAAPSFGPA